MSDTDMVMQRKKGNVCQEWDKVRDTEHNKFFEPLHHGEKWRRTFIYVSNKEYTEFASTKVEHFLILVYVHVLTYLTARGLARRRDHCLPTELQACCAISNGRCGTRLLYLR